jgi:hypothetical protein
MWRKNAVIYVKILSWKMPGGTKENYDILESS